MRKKTSSFLSLVVILALMFPAAVSAQPSSLPSVDTTFTVLHTNDFHGNLEQNSGGSTSNPGMARVAKVINDVRAAAGADNVLLVDAGDEMQGSLLSNLQFGAPTIAVFNAMGYDVATLGNHEFDWGQTVLTERTTQADFPYVSANIVSGSCDSSNWTSPSFATPYVVKTVGTSPNTIRVGLIGVTSTETPTITIASATAGLCFKDPANSIIHYYDELKAQSDVIIVLSHLGYVDGGYGYGLPVYGDQTLASKLITAGKPVPLIIGGHSHTDVAIPVVKVGGVTSVVQARYNGRQVGRADITVTPAGAVTVNWFKINPTSSGTPDPTIEALIATYTSDPTYQALISQQIGYTNVPLIRNYDGDSLMGKFVNDAIYYDLNNDGIGINDVSMVFNNAGGLRADIACDTPPCLLTHGSLYSVLPFGNQTVVGNMTGAQIVELLNQSGSLYRGALQVAGVRYKFYRYAGGSPSKTFAWGAYDICVINGSNCDPLDLAATYKVATNEFLAPAGQDGFLPFKYMTNITYWGDMLDGVERFVSANYGTIATAYNGTLDGRITRDGNDAGGSIVPITILHHNDMHGNLAKGTYVGYTQLATLIKQERAYNPDRTILLNGGDNIQGDAMSYYFKTAPTGFAVDGTVLDPPLNINPVIAAMNAMNYDAMTVGNHEYNFGKDVFVSVLSQANFPMLQANVEDDGSYGIASVPVVPYVEKTVGPEGIKVAILGIGNHRVPNYELPSNIPGLSFPNPITTAQDFSNILQPANDAVVALTHIGFTTNPASVEVDNNVDTIMAAEVSGLDAIIGSHSHTNPATGFGDYKYLPTIIGGPGNTPVIINQAYRYNNTLGEIILGMRAKDGGGYEVVSRAGQYLTVASTTLEDPTIKAIVDPYSALLTSYNNTVVGQTTAPIDALTAFTEETTGGNIQADASVFELESNGIDVDFHLSGAMTNKKVAATATPSSPVTLKVSDMFTLMPYENSLVVIEMNGPQLKAVLERAYRNYYYYKYVPGYGGYSYYTTCMLDTNNGNIITYNDLKPELPNGNNVVSLNFGGTEVDFSDASTFYRVSTVNYLAAGSCNFNNAGVSLWPLDQLVADSQLYVRDAVINYIKHESTVSPAVEGRLSFISDTQGPEITINAPVEKIYSPVDTLTIDFAVSDAVSGVKSSEAKLDGVVVTNGQAIDLATLAQGEHTFMVQAVDKVGLEASKTVTFNYDSMAPDITIISPEAKAYGPADTLTIDFAVEDLVSGVKSVEADLDGVVVTNGQVIDLTALAEGEHVFTVKAVDNVDIEGSKSVTFIYDSASPVITIVSPEAKAYTHPEKITLDFNAVDDTSGVKTLEAKLDGVVVTNGQIIDFYTLALGDHTFEVKAVDNAGNEATTTVAFSITATTDSLAASLNRFFSEGKIDNAGILNSLLKKLEMKGNSKNFANKLQAFINEVEAQSGKHVTAEAAALLKADALWVIAHLP